ncbi:MAG: site-2 protease family protein [Planctomycetota bacterium]
MSWWVHDVYGESGIVGVVSWIVIVIGSICLHELSHGWAALRQGDPTPEALGHMTWNPLVHMPQTSLFLFAFLGIAYGLMPVDPSRFRSRYGDAYVAAAGPAMNLLLAGIFVAIGGLVLAYIQQLGDPFGPNLLRFCELAVVLNVTLALFNLIPVPPLDGSRILGDFVPSYRGLFESENGQWVGLGLFLLVFFFAGRFLFRPGQWIQFHGINWFASLVGPAPLP